MEYQTESPEKTKAVGKEIATSLKGGDILLLSGDLGAGKTTLVKGIAEGLGIQEEITSPTFTLMNTYPVRLARRSLGAGGSPKSEVRSLIHIDTYRLNSENELLAIGAEDYLGNPDTVCIIEWPEKISTLLKDKKTTAIQLFHVSENIRKIIILQDIPDS